MKGDISLSRLSNAITEGRLNSAELSDVLLTFMAAICLEHDGWRAFQDRIKAVPVSAISLALKPRVESGLAIL